jgi:hypothetical protein
MGRYGGPGLSGHCEPTRMVRLRTLPALLFVWAFVVVPVVHRHECHECGAGGHSEGDAGAVGARLEGADACPVCVLLAQSHDFASPDGPRAVQPDSGPEPRLTVGRRVAFDAVRRPWLSRAPPAALLHDVPVPA